MLMIAGTAAGADEVDRAAAYYHCYTLAHMYAEMAAARQAVTASM